ncbi:zeta toxin family protein [Conexibacter woesei]|uniref:zeta toxin family protein n=1 Tax=Conexibacter woesei TaxID=191495 RepID=UPI00041E05BC|nr:zeta toxin family protein [Conexibacter woesei]
MSTQTLHVLAGPNGSGKSTFVRVALQPLTRLPFINADVIAAERWPGAEEEHAYDASQAAAQARDEAIAARRSFITETVFSHPSKVDLITQALEAGYVVKLHAIVVSEDIAVVRVGHRVGLGGHSVPETKIRERYRRLWSLVAAACPLVHRATFYDNMSDRAAYRVMATYEHGRPLHPPAWPTWAPAELTALGG